MALKTATSGDAPGTGDSGNKSPTDRLNSAFQEARTRLNKQAGRPTPKDEEEPGESEDEDEDDSEEEGSDEVPEDKSDKKEDSDDDEDEPEAVSTLKSKIAELLGSGDVKALCKLVGVSEKLADVANGKFARIRRNSRELKKEKQEFEAEKTQIKGENAKLRNTINYVDREFGDAITAIQEFNKGNFRVFAQKCGKFLKYKGMDADFATVTRLIAGVEAASPEERAKWAKADEENAEKSRKEKADKEESSKANEQKARIAAVNKIRERIVGHTILKRKDGAILVYEEMLKHYDKLNERFNITSKKAADVVLKRLRDEAVELGIAEKKEKKGKKEPRRNKRGEFQGFQHKIESKPGEKPLSPVHQKLQDRLAESRAKISRQMRLGGR